MDARRRIGERIVRALGILKAFSIKLPDGPELSIDVDAVHGPADSGDLATDLAGLFVELGEVARDHQTGVLITIDELHYVRLPVIEALVMGLHRATQLALPIAVAGAGLPALASLTGEAKSYAERIFTFPVIDSLDRDQAVEAIVVPAADEGVAWAPPALDLLLAVDPGLSPTSSRSSASRPGTWPTAPTSSPSTTWSGASRSPPPSSTTASSGSGPVGPTTPSGPTSGPWPSSGPGRCGRCGWPSLLGRSATALGPTRDDAHQEGPVLLAPLGGDRVHRAHVRRLHEAVDPGPRLADPGVTAGRERSPSSCPRKVRRPTVPG